MASKLKPPSQQVVNHVLQSAYSAPQANCEAAQNTMACIKQVADFFNALEDKEKSAKKVNEANRQ